MGRRPWHVHGEADFGYSDAPAARGDWGDSTSAHRCDFCAQTDFPGEDHRREPARHAGGIVQIQDSVAHEDIGDGVGLKWSRRRQHPPETRRGFRTWARADWAQQLATHAMLLVCLCLLCPTGGGDDSAALAAARMRLADTFDMRKRLSGESTFPHRYRSGVGSTGACCGGDSCVECKGESVVNLDATRLLIEDEIRLLRKLGCPCRIESLSPDSGSVDGGTRVTVTVSGLDLDLALARGPMECWVRMDLEKYVVVPATRSDDSADQLVCVTPPSQPQVSCEGFIAPSLVKYCEGNAPPTRAQYSQITLHAAGFAITTGETRFHYYDTRPPTLISIVPSGAPFSPGGAVLTVTGTGFKDAVDGISHSRGFNVSMWCVFAEVALPASVLSNETAICHTAHGMTPVLGKLFMSYNALEPAGTDTLDFAVYHQPRISGIWPTGGYGDEPIIIQAAGLGYTYQPREGEILCIFLQQHQEKVVEARRVGNTSTVTCIVPNNTRGGHIIAGEVQVEISLIGGQRQVRFAPSLVACPFISPPCPSRQPCFLITLVSHDLCCN
jgi:hypothetical protein